MDEEDARRDLLRRFLHWLGPATPAQFARWAGVSRADADTTWNAVQPCLVPVSIASKTSWILAADEAAFTCHAARLLEHVRFLPPGDPYLYPAGLVEVSSAPNDVTDRHRRAGVASRVLNSLSGRLLIGAGIVGSWGRVGSNLTIAPWDRLVDDHRGLVTAEITRLDAVLGQPVRSAGSSSHDRNALRDGSPSAPLAESTDA